MRIVIQSGEHVMNISYSEKHFPPIQIGENEKKISFGLVSIFVLFIIIYFSSTELNWTSLNIYIWK